MGISKLLTSGKNIYKGLNHSRILIRSRSDAAHRSDCCGDRSGGSAKKKEDHKCSSGAGESSKSGGGGSKGLVVCLYENKGTFELPPVAQEIDSVSGGKLSSHLSELAKDMKLGKAFVVTDVHPDYSALALASVGPAEAAFNKLEEMDESRENIRWGVGAGVSALAARGAGSVTVAAPGPQDAAGEAATLAAFGFRNFKTQEPGHKITVSQYGGADADLWTVGRTRARAQNWARYLSDMPANMMTPTDLTQAAFDVLCPLGVKVTARNRAWIEAHKMEAFLHVARGSCEEPILLECEYSGGGNQGNVLVVAKGVTFDSGGICLKRRSSMVENRGSMAGAAVTLGAIRAIAEMKTKVNVCAVIPLCENMVSGQCMKVGDVVRALNGFSIQIEDTDMEGRLMMADALVYGQNTYRPGLVMDIATLTHGILLATGGGAFGSFSNDEAAWSSLKCAGAYTGDRPWRFPLWNHYREQITNEISVDLRNKGSGKATPCIGAAFLRNFICGSWLHLDITGVGKLTHAPSPPYLNPHRMSGRPTRTVTTFFENMAKNCKQPEEVPCVPC